MVNHRDGKDESNQLVPLIVQEDEVPLAPSGIRGILFFLKLCSWWFAFSAMMGPLPSILWPTQIEILVGSEKKELYNGFIPAFGAVVSLVVTPIAGMLSDRSGASIGRRKAFLIPGSLIALVCYGLCGIATEFSSIWVFVAFTVGLQFGINFAAGPYAGLIPDCVHASQVGRASGFNGLGTVFGYLVGFAAAAVFAKDNTVWQVYAFLGAFFALFSLPTILGAKEIPREAAKEPLTLLSFLKSFYLDPKYYKSFYWVILTRLLEQTGYYTVLPFLQYFIQDVIYRAKPESLDEAKYYSSILLGVIVVTGLPASIRALSLVSNKFGRKPLVILSMTIMSASVAAMTAICYYHSLPILFAVAVVFGIGYGSFLAVDWALALDALPEGANVAKDMGIWHIAFVLPQVIAPMIAGQLLNYIKDQHSLELAYTVVFGVASFWFILATMFVFPIRLKPKYSPLK